MAKKISALRYATGGTVNPGFGAAAGAATQLLPDDMKYTKLGASAFAVNPLVGGVATAVGAIADIALSNKNNRDLLATQQKAGQAAYNKMPNPYAGANLGTPTMTAADGAAIPTRMTPNPFLQMPLQAMQLAQPGQMKLPENHFRFQGDQDRARYNQRTIEAADLKQAQDTYKAQLEFNRNPDGVNTVKFAQGGEAPVGHVVPAENALRAVMDARNIGIHLNKEAKMVGEAHGGIIPGTGHPKADDKVMKPAGAPPIAISSGELFVSDDNFGKMAAAQGMTTEQYAKQMYPNGNKSAAAFDSGGSVDYMDPLPTNLQRSPIPSGQLKSSGQPSPVWTPPNSNLNDLLQANKTNAIVNSAIQVGEGAYNLFSKRTPIPRPQGVNFNPLDLKTGALASSLDQQRQQSVATAVDNTRNKQGTSKDLAIVAADQAGRLANSAEVEKAQNYQNEYNNRGVNRVTEINTQAQNQWAQNNAQANDQFRMQKMQAIDASANGLTQSVGKYFQGNIDIQSQAKMDAFQLLYLKMRAGDPAFADKGVADIYDPASVQPNK